MVESDSILAASFVYPKPANYHPSYGTAGFRDKAELLNSTVFRCGILAAARALLLNAHTGIMITASHNPVADNGVKMVEPNGSMLPQSFEPVAMELANCEDDAAVLAVVRDRILGQLTSSTNSSTPSHNTLAVLVGHDTRPSAPTLLSAALAGICALNVQAVPCGCVTTPQLHFLVHQANHGLPPPTSSSLPSPQLQTYFNTLSSAFLQLAQTSVTMDTDAGATPAVPATAGPLYVDCANGVGALQLPHLAPALAAVGIELRLRNTGRAGASSAAGQLNHLCGADYVQKERLPPVEFDDVPAGARCCSLDGDADRLVYFSPVSSCSPVSPSSATAELGCTAAGGGGAAADGAHRTISLLDGDKVAMLAAVFIRELMDGLPHKLCQGLEVCCVQTAYANGAATAYLRDVLRLPTVCTPTGVKYLHEAAHKADLGIYFESNGHGTVLFSERLLQRLTEAEDCPAARELLALSRLINQTVGDALSGVLLVELILRRKGWTLAEWQALYSDLPSRQLKLKVADRAAIVTADAERVCVSPAGLQQAISEVVSRYPQGRAFARPSGTEDAVRIYAEATTQEQADELARDVVRLVYDMAGGVGPRP